jgi:YggT family protein
VLNLLGKYFGPLSDLLADMTEPLLRPIRKIIPPLGVIDLSAYIAVILLIALNMVLTDLLPAVR